jgi:hypothetical protein
MISTGAILAWQVRLGHLPSPWLWPGDTWIWLGDIYNWLSKLHVQWMYPSRTILTWAVRTTLVIAVLALWNTYRYVAKRNYWGADLELNDFSPRNLGQYIRLWVIMGSVPVILIVSLGGPNLSSAPVTVPAGSTQVMFIHDTSNSESAMDGRPYYSAITGLPDPGANRAWGTRLQYGKWYFTEDLLSQLADNQAGLIACGGVGETMAPLTRDLGEHGAFRRVLERYLQVGGAPYGGADYADCLQKALKEFARIKAKMAESGDTSEKERFIVFASDGGDLERDTPEKEKALNDALDEVRKEQIHLLFLLVGGAKPMSVPKYDPELHTSTGEAYPGTTLTQPVYVQSATGMPAQLATPGYPAKGKVVAGPQAVLRILQRMPEAELIYAPPGTAHIYYSLPERLGGLTSEARQSNLRPWLLAIDVALIFIATVGGGGRPRLRFFVPDCRSLMGGVGFFKSLRFRRNRKLTEG